MTYEQILYERRDDVALVTLNRPDRLNAWTPRMAEELNEAFGQANGDPAIASIVVTGAGRGFCAGADMQDTFKTRIDGTDPGANTAEGSGGMPAHVDWIRLCRESKPLIAAVNGAAVGIGMTQILPFDIIVASEKAKFGMAFIKVGLVPELASTHFLVQRVGFGRASEMCLTGRLYLGQQAFTLGLVERVTAPDDLMEQAFEVARQFSTCPPPQLRMIKDLLTQNAAETDLDEVQRRESALLRECWATPEHAEAVAAFLEKRTPKFR